MSTKEVVSTRMVPVDETWRVVECDGGCGSQVVLDSRDAPGILVPVERGSLMGWRLVSLMAWSGDMSRIEHFCPKCWEEPA